MILRLPALAGAELLNRSRVDFSIEFVLHFLISRFLMNPPRPRSSPFPPDLELEECISSRFQYPGTKVRPEMARNEISLHQIPDEGPDLGFEEELLREDVSTFQLVFGVVGGWGVVFFSVSKLEAKVK